MRIADLMGEMGLSRLDTSINTALVRKTRLRPDLIRAPELWLKKAGVPVK